VRVVRAQVVRDAEAKIRYLPDRVTPIGSRLTGPALNDSNRRTPPPSIAVTW
jgi:hypothetical protein